MGTTRTGLGALSGRTLLGLAVTKLPPPPRVPSFAVETVRPAKHDTIPCASSTRFSGALLERRLREVRSDLLEAERRNLPTIASLREDITSLRRAYLAATEAA